MILCRYNVDTLNICMKEFINFVRTDSTDIFFKLWSAGLNYNLPSFSLTLTVRGVSNKHCLLTFFHLSNTSHYILYYRTGIRCLCVLIPLMGLTWVIGIFYVNDKTVWIQYVFAVCNSLQVI